MQIIAIKPTNNPSILKFEFDEFIVRTDNFEFKNIDETQASPLAKQLFFLPFVKTVYLSGNFIAIEKFSIVVWEDVQNEVAEQIGDFINKGGEILIVEEPKNNFNPATFRGFVFRISSKLSFVPPIIKE